MKCEVCGCEHNGSYGSGRFCSNHCRRVFCGLKRNESPNKKFREKKILKCNVCGEIVVGSSKIRNHLKSHKEHRCKFCGRVFESGNVLGGHMYYCDKNPARDVNLLNSRLHSHKWSSGERKQISDRMKKFYAEHPESASYKYNHYSKGSWAEDYFRDLFAKENIVGWESQYHVLRYRLDFAFIKEKIDFEVDGHQHRVDARIVKHDIERTKNLEGIGWTVVRILWSDWNKMAKDEKHRWLKENLYCRLNQFRMDRGRTGYAPDFGIGVASQKCDDENGANSTNSARADNDELRGDEPKCVETIHPAPDCTKG